MQNRYIKIFEFEPSGLVRHLMGGMIEAGGMMGFGPVMMDIGSGGAGDSRVLDHSFNHGAIMYSLGHYVEPAIAGQHPDWNPSQVRTEARRQMTISLLESRTFSALERNREPVMEKSWEVVETSPGNLELRTTWGDQQFTLRQLWEHTREAANDASNPRTYNPAAYNQAEAAAQLAIQDALISGRASAAVTMISDIGSFRYAQVWEKGEDNTVRTKFIDLGLSAGRDFSSHEATSIMQGIAEFYTQTGKRTFGDSSNHPHFMVNEGSLDVKDIQTITHTQAAYMPIAQQTVETLEYATKSVLHETKESFMSLGVYVGKQIDDRIQHLRDVLTHRFISSSPIDQFSSHQSEGFAHFMYMKNKQMIGSLEQYIHPDKFQKIKSLLADWFISRTALRVSTETGVGLGGTLFWLQQLTQQKKQSLERPNVGEHIPLWMKALKDGFVVFHKTKLDAKASLHVMDQQETKKVTIRKEMVRGKDKLVYKKEIVFLSKKEKKRFKTREKNLFSVFLLLIEKRQSEKKKLYKEKRGKKQLAHRENLLLKSRKIEKKGRRLEHIFQKRKEKQYILNFSIALTIWMLLDLLEKKKMHLNSKGNEFKATFNKATHQKDILFQKKNLTEDVKQEEPTQWLLLAIIWHLAMIREQGMTQNSQVQTQQIVPKTNHKTYKFYPQQFPTAGVIFACTS